MTVREITQSGAVVFWTAAGTFARDAIRAALKDLGITAGLEAAAPLAALKGALESQFPGALIRPLSSKGYAIVAEERGDTSNQYESGLSVVLDDGRVTFLNAGIHPEKENAIRDSYAETLATATAPAVSGLLARIVTGDLNGISLKPHSGVCWIPEESLPAWSALEREVNQAARPGSSATCYTVKTTTDADTLTAITEGLAREVQDRAATYEEEVASGRLGKRAIANRKQDIENLLAKVATYESILSRALPELREAVDRAEVCRGLASIMGAVAPENDLPPADVLQEAPTATENPPLAENPSPDTQEAPDEPQAAPEALDFPDFRPERLTWEYPVEEEVAA